VLYISNLKEKRFIWLIYNKFIHKIFTKAISAYHSSHTYLTISQFSKFGSDNVVDTGIWVNKPDNISFGSNIFLGRNVYLNAYEKIEIGNFCIIAADCKLITANHKYRYSDIPIDQQGYECRPIKLHDNVWLGYDVIILPGVSLGKGCVVGAGSIVTKSFGDNTVIAGCPAKIIKTKEF
jgi:acetyltransferase-like isoleucine patch superfamily enzyme